MNVLAVLAHPDDESLFCGGTLAKHAKQGDTVMVVVLADGVTSRDGARIEDVASRKAQCERACEILGVSQDYAPLFPDQRSDTVAQLTINKAAEHLIGLYSPEMVYTHHVGDLNLDHRRVAEAVLVAVVTTTNG